MRLRHFHIERFGVLAAQKAENLAPGLNVFLGDNEAGKSTCRDFLRAMFFGYKRGGRNDLDYGNGGPGGSGGKASAEAGGGLLLDIDGPTTPIRLLRRPGKHGGEFSLYDAQGRSLPQSLWQGLLSGVTADLYDKVFAFDLQDLASLESMGGQPVSAALHGAAFGTGFRSPAEVLQSLERSRKELFSPSPTAKTQAINKILQRLREIRRKIRESGSDLERHAALSREEAALQRALEEQQGRREALERERARNVSLLGAWELWAELRRLETELELRPRPAGEFGPDSLTRLESLCTERAEKLAALEARQEELAALERQLGEEQPAADLLPLEPACRALGRERENAALALRHIPALEAELENLEREQEKLLAELGTEAGGKGWSRRSASLFDCSPAARELVDILRAALAAASAEVEQRVRDKERLERELERADLEEARLRKARGASGLAGGAPGHAFGPEMRLQLEEKGRGLEHSRQAAAECGKARLLLEREESRLQAALAARRKEMAGLAKITCREEDLREGRQDLSSLRRVAEQTESGAAEAALLARQQAERRPPLFSFTPLVSFNPLRFDPRRAVMALLSLGLAAFLLYPAIASLLASPLSGQELRGLLDGNGWAAGAVGLFGLFCLWSAVFWLFPALAALGLYHPAPDALQVRLLECLNRLAGHKRELTSRMERLQAWLPEQSRAAELPPADQCPLAAGPEPEAPLEALPAFYLRLESFFGTQQEQLLRLQLLRLQDGQELERAAALAAQLAEVRLAEREAAGELARSRELWAAGLAPYGLGEDTAPDAALQIFDRAWRCAELRSSLAEAVRRLADGGNALGAARADWTGWLAATPFPDNSGPGLVLDSFVRLARFKELQSEFERRQARLQALRSDLEAFGQAARALADGLTESRAEFGRRAGTAETPIQLFDRLAAAAEAAARREAVYRQRQRDLRALQGRRAEARAALSGSEAALRQLFLLAGLPQKIEVLQGAEEFRLRFAAYREHRELRLERDRLALQLEQRAVAPASGWPGPAEFRQALAAAGPELLAAQAALAALEDELRAALEQAGQQREETLTRLGEVRAGLAALAEGEGNAVLRREEAALREDLEQLARRWSVLTLAQFFIMRAKRSFEEERQDLVVRQAGDFFRDMTLERYQGLLFDLEKGKGLKASAVREAGPSLDSEAALSRGAREQLYLSLRLAYVRQHNQSRESLPLVMDDILVNFDPARAARTAAILAGFAGRNQILFFTCHPRLTELLTAAAAKAGVPCAGYRVERGEIRAG
ncbi:MAG: AAA family ATPase [Deltaproteobacteria bacterium]|jgi:uncharacterized protein YhaN|nr:AAA family ATPase [Deltaproteobacteria bacterium]